MEDTKSKIKKFFQDKVKSITERESKDTILKGYYCIEGKTAKVCIRNDLFVAFVFIDGSKWGENLFKAVVGEENTKTEVYEDLNVDTRCKIYDVELEDQVYEYGIVICKEKEVEKEYVPSENINLPIVLRIFHTEIPLSDIEKLGETSEFILDKDETFRVELLLNGKVIGEGELHMDNESYKLKITKVYRS